MSFLNHIGLQKCKRQITKEQYERALNNNSYITDEDEMIIFTAAERYGYGIYSDKVIEENGKYYCEFEMGTSCD